MRVLFSFRSGGRELLDVLKADAALMANPNAKAGVDEMSILFTYLEAYGVLDKVSCIVHPPMQTVC